MPSLPKAAVLLALLWWQEPTPYDPTQYDGGGASFVLMLLETLLALALVCGLAYAIFRWLPRLQVARSANSMIRVVDRVGLDARKSLFVIEVGGRWLLVAASESGVQLLSELDADELQSRAEEAGAARAASRESLADRFASILNRKR